MKAFLFYVLWCKITHKSLLLDRFLFTFYKYFTNMQFFCVLKLLYENKYVSSRNIIRVL